MFAFSFRPRGKIRMAFVVAAVFQLAGCGSPEDRAKGYYEHGMQLLAAHDNARAAIEFKNAVKAKKDLVGAWRGLAQIDELNQDWGGVVGNLRTVVQLDPSDVEAKLKLGKVLILTGRLDEALNLVNSISEADSQSAAVRTLKAGVLFKLNDSAGAEREARAALELDPGFPDALMVLAGTRLAVGDPKGALSILDQNPGSHADEVEKSLGIELLKIKIFERTGDSQGIEGILRKLVEQNPEKAEYRKLLIKFYVDQKRPDDAEKEMRAFAAAHPGDVQAGLDLIRLIYTVKKNPAGARQELVDRINAGGDVFKYQLALADMDFSEGKLAEGVELLQSLIKDDRTSDHVLTAQAILAQVYLGRKDLDAAEPVVADILRKDGRNTNGLKLRAAIRMERGQLDAAVTDLRQALNDQPRSTELMLMLAVAYERSGSIELAEKQFADATRASDFDIGAGLQYVAFLRRRGNVERVEDVLTELNSHRPNNVQVLSALAQVRLARQNYVGAQEVGEQIRKISNQSKVADEILGAALIGRKKFDDSIAAFQSAYNADPTAQPMSALVRALVAANKPDQALGFLQSVLKANPGNAEALVLLGSLQLRNQPDQALKNFTAAIKAQPKDVTGYQALSEFYVSQNKGDEALKVVRSGLEQQPDSFTLHLALAGLLERKGDYDAAIAENEFMLGKQSGNLIIANNLASLLADHRSDKASLDKAQTLAVSLRKSQVPQFKDTLGWVSYREGDYKNAVSLSEEAVTDLPNVAIVRYHLGMSYVAAGQPDKGIEQLRKALDLAPPEDLANQIHAALRKVAPQ
jgi:tetratricopeptide (TPR) repeat protein